MKSQEHVPIERMEFFQRYVEVADWVWDVFSDWSPLAAETVGKQLIRAADSIGANLVEGDGRYHDADALHFFIIARASARETRYWLQRAMKRKLLSAEEGQAKIEALSSVTQMLNALIRYRRKHARNGSVHECRPEYETGNNDPFVEP